MKVLQKDDVIIECNHCKSEMPLFSVDEGGLMLFICEECGTYCIDVDGEVEWNYPKYIGKKKFCELVEGEEIYYS